MSISTCMTLIKSPLLCHLLQADMQQHTQCHTVHAPVTFEAHRQQLLLRAMVIHLDTNCSAQNASKAVLAAAAGSLLPVWHGCGSSVQRFAPARSHQLISLQTALCRRAITPLIAVLPCHVVLTGGVRPLSCTL